MASRLAVVTGGGRGIGHAIAVVLTGAGHRVVVVGRNEASLAETVATGAATAYHVADVTDTVALEGALRRVGTIDVLVNNAGASDSAPFLKSDDGLFRRMMAVNFDSVVTATRAVLPGMVERGFGRIISIASVAGLKGAAYASAYAAAKHAVVGLTRSIALEVAQKGVTVNAVCPGYVDTDMMKKNVERVVALTDRSPEEAMAVFVNANPQRRLISAAEVADAVVWLAGDGAAAVNGQAIALTGGEG